MNRQEAYNKTPGADGRTHLRARHTTNRMIVNQVLRDYKAHQHQVKDLAHSFRGATDRETIQNVYHWMKKHLTYDADDDPQAVKSPAALLASGTGDCKSFSLFAAAILNELGIPSRLRFVSEDKTDPNPNHVYVVTPYGPVDVVVDMTDGINGLFNEIPYYFFKDYDMQLVSITGRRRLNPMISGQRSGYPNPMIGQCNQQNRPINGWWENLKKAAFEETQRQRANPQGATIAAAPSRAAFIELLKMNVRDYARKLDAVMRKDPDKLKKKWNSLGGNYTQLKKAILKGRNKKRILGATGIGVAISTILVAAGAVLLALAPLFAEGDSILDSEKGQDYTDDGNNNNNNNNNGGDNWWDNLWNTGGGADVGGGRSYTPGPGTGGGFLGNLTPTEKFLGAAAAYFLFVDQPTKSAS